MHRFKLLTLSQLLLLILLGTLAACDSCQKHANKVETTQADSLIDATSDLLFTRPLQADSIYSRLQQHTADSAVWWRAHIFRGTVRLQLTDSAGAERHYRQAIQWCQTHPGHEVIEGQAWNHKGVAAAITGHNDQAIQYYERSYALFRQAPQKSESIISTAINLADLYQHIGHMPRAAYYYRQALFLCDSLHAPASLASIYCGLGQLYADLSDFDQAHHYFSLARPLMPNEPMTTRLYYHMSLGNCHYFERRYDEAIRDFAQGRQLARQFHHKSSEFKCETNMMEVELMRNDLPAATLHLQRAEALAAVTPDIDKASLFYLNSLKTDWAMAQGHLPQAKQLLAADADTTGIQSLRYLMLHYQRLQHYAAQRHDWHNAYQLQSEAARYADSLRGIQSTNHVEEMKLRFERDTTLLHQQLALADYETRMARQGNLIMTVIAAALFLLLAFLFGLWLYRRRVSRRMQQQIDRITELRMDIVRNRVSPHYIFNVLNTVLPRMSRHPDINVPITLLIYVLRGNLLTSGKVAVTLHDEIQLVQRFAQLHGLSKGPWPRVRWNIDEGLETSTLLVPAMSLQIPVENALKHAFPTPTADSIISITVTHDVTTRCLHLSVADNGKGYDPGQVRPTGRDTGTGLRLLSRTISILNRHNARPATFAIANRPSPDHGTLMQLTLPDDYDFNTPAN